MREKWWEIRLLLFKVQPFDEVFLSILWEDFRPIKIKKKKVGDIFHLEGVDEINVMSGNLEDLTLHFSGFRDDGDV